MKPRRCSSTWAVFFFVLSCLLISEAFAADVPKMSKEELQAKLGNPDVIIIDNRSPTKIGREAALRSKEPSGKIPPRYWIGWINIPKTRLWSSTVPDRTRRPVPGWHGILWKKDTPRSTP